MSFEQNDVNMAVLKLLNEWEEQEKKGRYKIHRLRARINALASAVALAMDVRGQGPRTEDPMGLMEGVRDFEPDSPIRLDE